MKKIISISIDETILKHIDESRGIATRSKFIETILMTAEYRCWNLWSASSWTETEQNNSNIKPSKA